MMGTSQAKPSWNHTSSARLVKSTTRPTIIVNPTSQCTARRVDWRCSNFASSSFMKEPRPGEGRRPARGEEEKLNPVPIWVLTTACVTASTFTSAPSLQFDSVDEPAIFIVEFGLEHGAGMSSQCGCLRLIDGDGWHTCRNSVDAILCGRLRRIQADHRQRIYDPLAGRADPCRRHWCSQYQPRQRLLRVGRRRWIGWPALSSAPDQYRWRYSA